MKPAFTVTLAAALRCGGLACGLLLAACTTQTDQAAQSGNSAGKPPDQTTVAVAPEPAPPPLIVSSPARMKQAEAAKPAEAPPAAEPARADALARGATRMEYERVAPAPAAAYAPNGWFQPLPGNTEKYQSYGDNPVKLTSAEALSTISLDVDTGSYSNVR
ncbi:MAG: von Willebrand factor type A domain-containing protein, partial [Azonexus sp.]|nr:von Willebrand factor type A domain-containing protein [Azonexus sp.]